MIFIMGFIVFGVLCLLASLVGWVLKKSSSESEQEDHRRGV